MSSRTSPPPLGRFVYVVFLGAAFAGCCLAEEKPQAPALHERGPVAEKYLREKLAVWQRRLQLQAWTISVEMIKPEGLRPATLGNIRWDPENKTAVIRVLHASDYQMPFTAALKDMEFTLVHELIHLTFSRLPRHETNLSDEERAINQIADALLQRDGAD